jgi:glycine/sarcosine N-methyltransferase
VKRERSARMEERLAPLEAATAFYDALAPMFDVMTDWEARLAGEGPFLREALRDSGAVRVLDAACGSGGHALALARWGYQAAGADASPAMIALARQKAAEAGLVVPFSVSDLAGLSDMTLRASALQGTSPLAPPLVGEGMGERFDAVLCLGNSLPHLLTQADLVAALRGTAGVLRPGGLFITQNLNYDLRWVRQPRFFAAQGGLLDGREVLVWRFADYEPEAVRIAFHIALFRKGDGSAAVRDWDVQVHTTPQRPLFRADLLSALSEAGFTDLRCYARMALPLESFDPGGSGDLVVVGRKG